MKYGDRDTAHSQFFFLVVDGIAEFPNTDQFAAERTRRSDGVAGVPDVDRFGEGAFHHFGGAMGQNHFADSGAMQIHTAADVGVELDEAGSVHFLNVDALFAIGNGQMGGHVELVHQYPHMRQGELRDGEIPDHAAPQAISLQAEVVIQRVRLSREIAEALQSDHDDVGRTLGDFELAADFGNIEAALGAVQILENQQGAFHSGSVRNYGHGSYCKTGPSSRSNEKEPNVLTLLTARRYAECWRIPMPTVIHNFAEIDFDLPGKHHYQVAFHLDGSWGYSLVPFTVINGKRGSNPNGVLCFGGTHGNEYEGQVGVKRLCTDLNPEQMAGRLVLMPQLSESACVANSRTSPLDGVNMNRAFPGNPRGTVSSRIANFVKTRIFPLGRIVIDIHAGGMEGAFPHCTSFHPIADPAQRAEIAEVSQLFDTGFALIYASTMASGLLTDEAEAEGKVTVGSELGAGASTDRLGVRHAYDGVKNVLRHYGLLEGEIEKIRPAGSEPVRLIKADQLDAYVPCPRNGVWEPVAQPGEAVARGELLGRLHDFSDHSSAALDIFAPRAGWVAMLHLGSRPVKGQTLFVVAEEVDWAEVMG